MVAALSVGSWGLIFVTSKASPVSLDPENPG